MEARPEESRTDVTQGSKIQPILVSTQEGLKPTVEGPTPDQKTTIPADNPIPGGTIKDIGNYGPWMLVKKQPRKKISRKNKDYSTQAKVPPKDNLLQGSRFDLLQEDEVQEAAKLQDGPD
ncbi:hypothetical protein SESBI_11076 [Sesbania bispinosa]|nr:hypothetical protein SESBI_11076 [Sesbania bispinosa]